MYWVIHIYNIALQLNAFSHVLKIQLPLLLVHLILSFLVFISHVLYIHTSLPLAHFIPSLLLLYHGLLAPRLHVNIVVSFCVALPLLLFVVSSLQFKKEKWELLEKDFFRLYFTKKSWYLTNLKEPYSMKITVIMILTRPHCILCVCVYSIENHGWGS